MTVYWNYIQQDSLALSLPCNGDVIALQTALIYIMYMKTLDLVCAESLKIE